MKLRRATTISGLASFLTLAGTTGAAAAVPHAQTDAPTLISPAAAGKIDHIFVIMQEKHTFDNYFGTFRGADGFPVNPSTLQVPNDPANPSGGTEAPFHLTKFRTTPFHYGVDVSRAALDGGKMDKFIKVQNVRNKPGKDVLGYYDGSDLPVYWQLARQYVLADRFFSSAQGGDVINHEYWVAGRAAGPAESIPSTGLNLVTIFDRLDSKNLAWKFYIRDYAPTVTYKNLPPGDPHDIQVERAPILAIPRFVEPSPSKNIVDESVLFRDLNSTTAPTVGYIVLGGSSESPPSDVANGQYAAAAVITAIMRSSAWAHSAIILTWDDWGGWYDHVVPPQIDSDGYGFRVPALIISPYAKRGYIYHELSDFTSILHLIELVNGLAPLATRDAKASDLLAAFDFNQAPRYPSPPYIAGVTDVLSGPSPARLELLYSLAALAALGFFFGGWHHRRGLRKIQ